MSRGGQARAGLVALACLLAASRAPAGDPDRALQQARAWKAEHRGVLDEVFADPAPARRAEAVRRFFQQHAPDGESSRAILDLDATIASPAPRLMLLDRLGAVPGPLEPAEAIAISRALLDSPAPEERLVAWRNLARLSPEDRGPAARKLRQIIRGSAAQDGGSFAFGQAFDGLVFLRDAGAIPLLAKLARSERNAALAGATLDRLAAADPERVAAFLNAHPGLLDDFPLLRADYFAKGSLGDEGFRKEAEKYLRRPEVGEPEIEKFVFSYLQGGRFLVSGIFTGEAVPEAEGADRFAEMEAAAARWKGDPTLGRAWRVYQRVREQISDDPGDTGPR